MFMSQPIRRCRIGYQQNAGRRFHDQLRGICRIARGTRRQARANVGPGRGPLNLTPPHRIHPRFLKGFRAVLLSPPTHFLQADPAAPCGKPTNVPTSGASRASHECSSYAATLPPSKGRLIRSTVPGSTPNRSAILRTPSVRPGALRAARIRASRSGAIRGRPSFFPSALARQNPRKNSLSTRRFSGGFRNSRRRSSRHHRGPSQTVAGWTGHIYAERQRPQ